jgi:hypothetical protein
MDTKSKVTAYRMGDFNRLAGEMILSHFNARTAASCYNTFPTIQEIGQK